MLVFKQLFTFLKYTVPFEAMPDIDDTLPQLYNKHCNFMIFIALLSLTYFYHGKFTTEKIMLLNTPKL